MIFFRWLSTHPKLGGLLIIILIIIALYNFIFALIFIAFSMFLLNVLYKKEGKKTTSDIATWEEYIERQREPGEPGEQNEGIPKLDI
jgi:protein-S-isoprenylcysteine O-methyltransferase Ste14